MSSRRTNYNIIQKMREQYKYAKEEVKHLPNMLVLLEYETILWERHLDVSLRGEGIRKGTFPKIVDLTLYKRTKEAWESRLGKEKKDDGKS